MGTVKINSAITRRNGLTMLAGAAGSVLAAPWISPAAATQPDHNDLVEALRRHLRYSGGFRRKLETGFYAEIGRRPTQSDGIQAFSDIRERLGALDGDNLALVHHVGEDRRLSAWLISPTGLVASHRSPYVYNGLRYLTWALNIDQRMQTRKAIPRGAPESVALDPPARDDLTVDQALRTAADELLGPDIGAALSERSGRLMVLPARDTGQAPFAALPLPGGAMLIRKFAIVIVPDVETLADRSRVHNVRDINWRTPLLVGNPDLSWNDEFHFSALPHAQAEVETVGRLFGLSPERILTGAEAKLDRVVRECSSYGSADIVYLASHAIANSVNPMDGSFVGLTDGNLTGQMLRGDKFEAWGARHPIVVLSACQTALGKIFDGGSYGMSRVMFAAGAAQTVSSLWSVDDAATRELMTEFADRLYLGYTTESALQRAHWKAADLYEGDPGAWASFCVYGMPSIRART